MKFVHAADLHIDSPLRGLERYEGAPVEHIRGATRRALEHLVELCLNEKASLLVVAGDLYDGGWNDYSTGLFFCQQMAQAQRGRGARGVDPRQPRRGESTDAAPAPARERDRAVARPAEHARARPRRRGRGGPRPGFPKQRVTDDLSERYPAPIAGAFNLGLLHTALDGREGHDRYAPCRVEAS